MPTGEVGLSETIAREVRKLEDAEINHLYLYFTPALSEFERFTGAIKPLTNDQFHL